MLGIGLPVRGFLTEGGCHEDDYRGTDAVLVLHKDEQEVRQMVAGPGV